ncbi:MAG TPA: hypothetical protein VNB54_13840 [Alphaproteobacteria bacterium]|nr:hypothetical protein [Alphaproteobacteria bacterium]
MPVAICVDWSVGAAADAALAIAASTKATRTVFNIIERENIGNLLPNARKKGSTEPNIPAPWAIVAMGVRRDLKIAIGPALRLPFWNCVLHQARMELAGYITPKMKSLKSARAELPEHIF